MILEGEQLSSLFAAAPGGRNIEVDWNPILQGCVHGLSVMKMSESSLEAVVVDALEQYLVSREDYLAAASTHYEPMVFELAMELCLEDAALAVEVFDEVFAKLEEEREQHLDEPLATLLHRYTYQSALLRVLDPATELMQ